jgi:hypothetical protein
MTHSDELTALLPALCLARAAMPAIAKNCTAEVRSAKGNYTFDYADLGAILEAVVPALTAQGLLLTFGVSEPREGRVEVSARLWHCASAQYLDNALSAPKPESLTATGSLITYLKRYTSTALLGVSAEADDDASAADGNSITLATTPAAATNGHAPAPTVELAVAVGDHPTEVHISALRALALKDCAEPEDVLADRIRRAMGLKAGASVAPKLLTRTMSMAQYMAVFEHYTALKAQLARKLPEGSTHGAAQAPTHAPAPESAVSAAVEDTPAVPPPAASPVASSSAGSSPADAAAVEELVREAVSLGLREKECRHIVTHYPLEKARQILTDAARKRVAA